MTLNEAIKLHDSKAREFNEITKGNASGGIARLRDLRKEMAALKKIISNR